MEVTHPPGSSAEEHGRPDGTVLKYKSTENHFAQSSETLFLCYQENRLQKFICLPCPVCWLISLQQRPRWPAFRPWQSYLAQLNCELLQSHSWFMVSSLILHSHTGVAKSLGAHLTALCAAGNFSAVGLCSKGLSTSSVLRTLGKALKLEALGD